MLNAFNYVSIFLAIYYDFGYLDVSTASVALAMSSALNFAFTHVSRNATEVSLLQLLIRKVEIKMNSVERIQDYSELESEGARSTHKTNKKWPQTVIFNPRPIPSLACPLTLLLLLLVTLT